MVFTPAPLHSLTEAGGGEVQPVPTLQGDGEGTAPGPWGGHLPALHKPVAPRREPQSVAVTLHCPKVHVYYVDFSSSRIGQAGPRERWVASSRNQGGGAVRVEATVVEQAVNQVDPMGLVGSATGAYERETDDVLEQIVALPEGKLPTADDIQTILHETFAMWFGYCYHGGRGMWGEAARTIAANIGDMYMHRQQG